MKLTRNKIISGILLFLVIVNLLVLLDLELFYIRAILAFIFLITIPGLLIILCFKIRTIGFWEYLVYTVGLSVAFIMFAGLHANWTLPALGITDKPLSTIPILVEFDIFLVILSFLAYYRNKYLEFEIKFPKFSWLDRIFIIVPMFFPALSVLGAFLLNNNGPNYLTMVMLGGIAVYVFCIVLFHKKLNENVFPWAILMISISLLLMGWLRSWYVSGVDTNLEYRIFQLTKENSLWSLSNFRDAYNAMLSVGILPTILSLFVNIGDNFILKISCPIIFSLVPLIVYLIAKNYFKEEICFLASFFFMSQQAFVTWITIPIRQQIAFLFFSLMLLILFKKDVNSELKKILFLVFGFSMIVSHYSTSYIALALFLLTYILIFLYKKWENKKIKRGNIKVEERKEFFLTGLLVLLLFIFGFLWYSQVTPTAEGLIDFMHKSFNSLENIFVREVQAEGRTPLDQFNIFFKPLDQRSLLKDYINETEIKYIGETNTDPLKEYSSKYGPLHIMNSRILPSKTGYKISNRIYLFGELLKKLMKVFIIVGFFSTIFASRKIKNKNGDYAISLIACFFLFGLLIILPFISIQYDVLRTYQQVLIILSLQAVLGGLLLFRFFKEKFVSLIITLLFLLYFLFISGFVSQAIGGIEGSLRLNNFGLEYNIYFTHAEELTSADWLFSNYNSNVYSDRYATTRLDLSNKKRSPYGLAIDILPQTKNKNSYVYLDYSNVFQGMAFKPYKGNLLSYNFPIEFLNENENKIYANGGSEIFK